MITYHPRRITKYDRIWRNVAGHEGIGADDRPVANSDFAGEDSIRPDVNAFTQLWITSAAAASRHTDRDTLTDVAHRTDYHIRSDEDVTEMTDVKARAYACFVLERNARQ